MVRGAPRATQDVDVTVEVPADDVRGLVAALSVAGLAPRFPELAGELLARAAVLPLRHASGMEFDLEALALSRASRETLAACSCRWSTPRDLVVMKVLAGRSKDLDDVVSVLASDEVDVDEAGDLLRQLEEALDSSELVVSLRAAVGRVPAR
jgi:hypothetical protein